jgi:Family of unknown function (DUF6941)
MHLCDALIVEENTRRVSLINCFSALRSAHFPTGLRPFWVFADLTDASGLGTAELVVIRASSGERVYTESKPIRFVDRLRVVQYGWRVTGCSFPVPGRYFVTLRVDGDWVAQRWLDLLSVGMVP